MVMLKFNYANCLSEFVGSEGISLNEINSMNQIIKVAHKNMQKQRNEGKLGFMELPYKTDEVKMIDSFVKSKSGKFDNFIVIGIGGSALGNIALQQALKQPYWNLLDNKERKKKLRLFVTDNVDPEAISGLIDKVDLKKTLINVISKSGTTSECLANFFVIRDKLIKKVNKKRYKEHIIITTDSDKGYLRDLANKENISSFNIPQNVGGRFSVLSPVGLVSAAFTGINIKNLLLGAQEMDKKCFTDELLRNPAALYATIQFLFYNKNKKISVMMPYSNSLCGFADWFRQLWAESLGKKFNKEGVIIEVGPTPVKALGVTDQHSQIQLFIEGPYDKIITFLSVEKFRANVKIPKSIDKHYLEGHTLNELLKSEEEATRVALTEQNRPNCTIIFPEINELTVGQFIYLFELSTAYAGELFNINTYDQPGVDLGKQLAYALLGRPGYESKKHELENKFDSEDKNKYII